MAELSTEVLQAAFGDKTLAAEIVSIVLDDALGETNPVILSVTPDVADSGVSVDIGVGTFSLVGAYREQFEHHIKWSENQPPDHSPPTKHESLSWEDVPLFGVGVFDFLFAYIPPSIMSTTVTYSVVGTYDVADPLLPTLPAVETAFTGTVTQEVTYDVPSNVEEFKRRLP